MRRMTQRACVLVVAGLDPSGGAGLLADVATVRSRGLHAAGVATALTVQDSARCHGFEPVDPSLVERQLEALVDDLPFSSVKVGMLGTAEVARAVARGLAPLVERGVPVVLDPVLRASVGAELLDGEPHEALAPLLPMLTLLTPNRTEAEALSGCEIADVSGQRRAARALRALGLSAVLLKGGHLDGAEIIDLLDDGADPPLELRSPRKEGVTPHGTGCALSTEIACALALGKPLRDATAEAHAHVARRIAEATQLGRGRPFL